MKNIHIIPTDESLKKRGDLVQDKFGAIHIFTINDGEEYGKTTTKLHIYITSDEKIKKDEYYLGDDNHIYNLVTSVNNNGKKIVLTTDPTLIADGVQVIDDEFLEWFVKNPTCEFVEVNKKLVEFPLTFKMMYKITIPQEEPKQEILPEFTLSKNIFDKISDLPKTETLEEAAEKEFPLLNTGFLSDDEEDLHLLGHRKSFIKGAKWQAERMYSEEDLRQAYIVGKHGGVNQTYYDFDEWFKQNKKK